MGFNGAYSLADVEVIEQYLKDERSASASAPQCSNYPVTVIRELQLDNQIDERN